MRRMISAVHVYVLCAAVFAAAVFADTIELLSGAPVVGARVVEKTPTEVRFYTAGGNTLYMLGRPQVSRIIYDNGAVEDFGAAPLAQYAPPPEPPPPVAQYAPPPPPAPEAVSGAAAPAYDGGDTPSKDGGGLRLGVRVELSGYDVDALNLDRGRSPGYIYGYGGSIGTSVSIPVTNTMAFKPGLYFTYRAPFNKSSGDTYPTDPTREEQKVAWEKTESTREFAIGVPLLVQSTVTKGGGLFVEAGVDMGIPFGTTRVTAYNEYNKSYRPTDADDEKDVDIYDQRTKFDLGIVAGLGLKMTERFAVDLRSVTYLNSFFRIDNAGFNQYSLGASVLFP